MCVSWVFAVMVLSMTVPPAQTGTSATVQKSAMQVSAPGVHGPCCAMTATQTRSIFATRSWVVVGRKPRVAMDVVHVRLMPSAMTLTPTPTTSATLGLVPLLLWKGVTVLRSTIAGSSTPTSMIRILASTPLVGWAGSVVATAIVSR
ncbi:MAG: hypothetical protein AUJ37_04325 [Candidatus Magasanikbacteria bacterium CG1_02_41_34]|uniref:Secreted protein n=1 Tax=Candidatus Magasanikbacteria bacterium CG_4_10_14_0_2_um_filter_41_31 TaxID=1974639 RepID=A0A2M7V4V2_9BACT|nr:MAG: hypothetical protein AUJ37_04325 [Candidatus Magasanikbacteria bacterium CG1_02_41_34]PIZ93593.1 MAG: hypothetical protein COX83_01475 [Candidatus Magasanikbacteria bacterium CG_4_10_14_0_2_um_filter_41_31]